MLAEYKLYQENYSANRLELQEQLKKVQEIIRRKAKDILRFHVEPTEYENTAYSDDTYHHTEEQLEQAKEGSEQASRQYSEASTCHTRAESKLEQAKEKLAELHAELLPRSEVGSDFEHRIKECESALKIHDKDMQDCPCCPCSLNAPYC